MIYGNSRQQLMEQYIGHAEDKTRQSRMHRHAGSQTGGINKPALVPCGRSNVGIPSDITDADGTLIRFVYQIGLQPSAGGYDMILTYDAAPATERSHGKINDISVRSNSQVVQAAMMKVGIKDGVIRLSESSAKYAIPIRPVGSLRLVEQRYVFYDVQKRIVGEIAAPYLSAE